MAAIRVSPKKCYQGEPHLQEPLSGKLPRVRISAFVVVHIDLWPALPPIWIQGHDCRPPPQASLPVNVELDLCIEGRSVHFTTEPFEGRVKRTARISEMYLSIAVLRHTRSCSVLHDYQQCLSHDRSIKTHTKMQILVPWFLPGGNNADYWAPGSGNIFFSWRNTKAEWKCLQGALQLLLYCLCKSRQWLHTKIAAAPDLQHCVKVLQQVHNREQTRTSGTDQKLCNAHTVRRQFSLFSIFTRVWATHTQRECSMSLIILSRSFAIHTQSGSVISKE